MPIPSDCYISQALCVATFDRDTSVRHKSAPFENAFQEIIRAQVSATNVPDDFPPDIPRLQIKSAKKLLTLSQINAQLALNFEKADNKTVEEVFEIVEKNFALFWQAVCSLKNDQERKEVGIVLTVNQPTPLSQKDVAANLFERFFKVRGLGQAVSTAFQVGFEVDGIFKNMSVGMYEIRHAEIDLSRGQRNVLLNTAVLPIQESGVEYKFDVNNRPTVLSQHGSKKSADELVLGGIRDLLFSDTKVVLSWA